MSLKKQYLKTKPVCVVTFCLPKNYVKSAKSVQLLGDFNNWEENKTNLNKVKDGDYMTKVVLDVGKEYQFRYLIDGTMWHNDSEADKIVPSNLGFSENSVLVL
ncbi:MAG: glycoside hydrolase [Bacteroidetes bacterium GWA2_30_7]|nr:MAG: glycoside hydrolase [Bacteroidetes bacterium GWA2_30_7]